MFATHKVAELGYDCINCLLALLPVCAAHTGTLSNGSKNRAANINACSQIFKEPAGLMINMVEGI